MKNTLWRFGDSWSTTQDTDYFKIELNHSKYVADYFNLDYKNLGIGGYSNLQIFNDLIKNQNNFKENDIILINFASVSRVAVVENGIVSCVSNGDAYNTHKLMDRNIRTYFFFLDQRVELGLPNELVFKSNLGSGFIHWCIENDYQDLSPKGNVHYKLGSQKDIANKIIQLIGENDNQEKRMGNQ
jgi:hypothetical protein